MMAILGEEDDLGSLTITYDDFGTDEGGDIGAASTLMPSVSVAVAAMVAVMLY